MNILRASVSLVVCLLFLPAAGAQAEDWRTTGPYGGSFQSFLFHPARDNIVFASGLDGLFRSTDTGLTWRRVNLQGGEFVVRIHPANPSLILAAGSSHGIYNSTDEGETWNLAYRYEFQSDAFYDMEFHPQDPKILYAVSYEHGVYASTDTGATWNQRNNGLQLRVLRACCVDIPQIEIDPSNGKTLYVLLPNRVVYRSDNGGQSWKSASHGLELTKEVHALTIDPRNTMQLYAGGANGIFRTINGGKQWSSRNCKCYIWSLVVNPHDAREVYGVGEGALKSVDGGKSWAWFSPHPYLSGILLGAGIHPRNSNIVLVGGFGGGIFRSTDAGRNWETVNQTLDALNVVRLVADPSTPGRLFAVGGQQAFESRDSGKSWDLFLKGQGSMFWVSDIAIHPKNPKLIVAAGYRKTRGALTISPDGGKTWQTRSTYAGVNYGCSNCIALDPQDENILYIAPFTKEKDRPTQLGVARSTDQGKSWSLINNGLASRDIWMLAVSPLDSSVLFAGSGTGALFRSTDAGSNWISAGAGLDQTSIRAITFDRVHPAILYLATYTSIFKSTDGGLSWTRKSEGMPKGAWLNFVDVDAGAPETIYAAGEAGLFISRDAAEHWELFEGGAPGQFAVWNFLIDPLNPKIHYAGTDRGVFALEVK